MSGRAAGGGLKARLPFIAIVLVLTVLGVLLQLRIIQLPAGAAATAHLVFNYSEACVWAIAGSYVLWRSRGQRPARRLLGALASVAFFAFGASDLVEARTGTWYHPWWLLAWKTACVAVLLSCLVIHARLRRPEAGK